MTGSRGLAEDGSGTTRGFSSDRTTAAGTATAAAPAAAPADAFRNDSRVTPSPSVLALLITAPLRGPPGPVWLETNRRPGYAEAPDSDHRMIRRTPKAVRA